MKNTTLVIVSFNTRPVLELCLKSYVKHHFKGEKLEIFLWDNDSKDDTKEFLRANGIPFYESLENVGHENAVCEIYKNHITTKYVLLSDSDVIYNDDMSIYLPYLNDTIVAAGDLVTGDQLNGPVKPRLGAWMVIFDIDTCKEHGIVKFRDNEGWQYDVGSHFYEQIIEEGLGVYVIPRFPGNINEDMLGMRFGSFDHLGRLSWIIEEHEDRRGEIEKRQKYVLERLKDFEDIDLKDKFKNSPK